MASELKGAAQRLIEKVHCSYSLLSPLLGPVLWVLSIIGDLKIVELLFNVLLVLKNSCSFAFNLVYSLFERKLISPIIVQLKV